MQIDQKLFEFYLQVFIDPFIKTNQSFDFQLSCMFWKQQVN